MQRMNVKGKISNENTHGSSTPHDPQTKLSQYELYIISLTIESQSIIMEKVLLKNKEASKQ